LRSPKNIVFSPHIDDEVIGCFEALNRGLITDVVYFYDITEERKREALASAARFGFTPWFCNIKHGEYAEIPVDIHTDIRAEDSIFCTTTKDSHPQHREVNRIAREYKMRRGCDLVFYTVDMESFQKPLPPVLRNAKKEALAELFPSQSALLENEKYHLFEGYSVMDHENGYEFEFDDVKVYIQGYYPPLQMEGPRNRNISRLTLTD